jgi:hypothetical protein
LRVILTGTGSFHDTQNGHTKSEPKVEGEDNHNNTENGALLLKCAAESHVPKHDRKLLVSEGKRPKTEVGGGVRNTVETELNGVNNLVNHDVGEVEFLVLLPFLNILGDHGNTLAIAGHAITVTAINLSVVVESADTGLLAKSPVSQGAGTVVLTAQPEWLEEEHDGYLNDSDEEQEYLNAGLVGEKWFGNSTGAQEHEDKHVEQTRRVLSDFHPIHRPLVEDSDNEVTENGLEEQHAGNEVTPDVNLRLEVSCVDQLEAESIGHLVILSV